MNVDPHGPLSPENWLNALFTPRAVNNGGVIRRKARDIERYCGWQAFCDEVERRGFRAYRNCEQVIVFCNQAPIRRIV